MIRKCCLAAMTVLFYGIVTAQQQYDRNRFNLYIQEQDYEQAINYLRASIHSTIDETRYAEDLGYACFMNEQYKEAVVIFLGIYTRQQDHVQANLYLAQSYAAMDKPDSALTYYLHLTQLQPGNYRYWQKAASVFAELNNYDSAVVYLGRSHMLNPRSGKVLVLYANVLIKQQQGDAADRLINEFLFTDSSNEEVIAKRMDMSFRKADYKKVIYWGEKLWKDSSAMTMPYINLAYSYLNDGQIDMAATVCEWMISNNKANQSVLYCAALAYARKKNYERSNALLDECLKMSILPDAVSYFELRGDNYEEMKQYTKAIASYDTAYYIFKSPIDLYYAGRIQDKYLANRTRASFYYKQYLAKLKTPRNSGELRILEYVRNYLLLPESKN